jgi:hypothetical membrane protein
MMESIHSRRRYAVALTGVALYVILDAVAQLLPPHYSPISQAESDLAVGPYGYIMAINFLNRGFLSLEFLFALVGTVRLTGGAISEYRRGFTLLGIWSVGALLLAFFPTDVPATPVSWHGAIHLVVAVIAFLAGAFGALAISMRMGGNQTLAALRRFALPIAALAVVFCLLELLAPFFLSHLAARFGGLFERMFLGTMLVWIAAISVYVLRHEPKAAPPSTIPTAAS